MASPKLIVVGAPAQGLLQLHLFDPKTLVLLHTMTRPMVSVLKAANDDTYLYLSLASPPLPNLPVA